MSKMLTEIITEGRIMDDFLKKFPPLFLASIYVLIVFFLTFHRCFFHN